MQRCSGRSGPPGARAGYTWGMRREMGRRRTWWVGRGEPSRLGSLTLRRRRSDELSEVRKAWVSCTLSRRTKGGDDEDSAGIANG